VASFFDSIPQLAPITPPSIFDMLFCLASIVSGGDKGSALSTQIKITARG